MNIKVNLSKNVDTNLLLMQFICVLLLHV
jgi:hypothetical protein